MSNASCCCGPSPSAAAEPAIMGTVEIKEARSAIQKRFDDARSRRQIFPNMSLSQKIPDHRDEFRQLTCSLARYQAQTVLRLSYPYLLSFAAMTSISTRNPGLASAATPTTDLAGRLG